MQSLSKSQRHFSKKYNKKYLYGIKDSLIDKTTLKGNKARSIIPPDLKLYYKAIVTVWYWWINRHIVQ